jgi:hypothetical protein
MFEELLRSFLPGHRRVARRVRVGHQAVVLVRLLAVGCPLLVGGRIRLGCGSTILRFLLLGRLAH